jgi:NADPH:quinone reductase-like Zn-dependent oxidoreductase
MKAITQDRFGSPDVLRFSDVDRPVPADDQVLVRVHAASLNARDWHVMRGDPYLARASAEIGLRVPAVKIRGTDFAGRVEAVGQQVTGVRPGDEVFGEAPGAFAEYVCAPAGHVAPKPAGLSFEEAAALPLAGNTALVGVRDVARVRAGQRLLVNGASGGVGLFAVQIAKAYGAEVTAVCSGRNVDLVRSVGADHVVDYTRDDFTRAGRRYDAVFDLVGNRSLADLRRTLAPAGTLVLSGGGVFSGGSFFGPIGLILRGRLLSLVVRQRVTTFNARQSRENLVALGEFAESGQVRPVVDRTYQLASAPEAMRYLEAAHARGKVIITV